MPATQEVENNIPQINIVRVVPLLRGTGVESLTYFSLKKIAIGSIVAIPLRNKTMHGLVISSENAAPVKIDLKKAHFKIKKIEGIKKERIFSESFIKAAEKTGHYFASTTGAVIATLTPKDIISHPHKIENVEQRAPGASHKKEENQSERFLFQAPEEERIAAYKNIVRGEFAKQKSVFICMPTISDILHFAPFIKHGIEMHTYVFHGKLSKKDLFSRWNAALSSKHPILIIATGSFFSLPRNDIGVIILEHENASAYKIQRRPFVDIRTFAQIFSQEAHMRLIVGDLFLRTETLYRKNTGEFLEFAPLKFRSLSSATQKIIDMKEKKGEENASSAISIPLLELAHKAQHKKEQIFIFTARRGLYPLTICGDCGKVAECPRCSAPVVLHKKTNNAKTPTKENVFMCHKCGIEKKSSDLCEACKSWRLKTLGIGTERIEEELKKIMPRQNIFRADKDSDKEENLQGVIDRFYSSPSAILIGTEMALPYIEKIPHIAVASIDSLFALPDFRIQERVFNLLLRAREKATKTFLVQTRLNNKTFWENVTQGNLLNFYREELENRKLFNYPPFVTLVKITWQGKREKVQKDAVELKKLLASYKLEIFQAFIKKIKGRYIMNAVMRFPRETWPNNQLINLLNALSPSFAINIEPENLL